MLYGNFIIVFLINSFFALVSLYLLRSKDSSSFKFLALVFLGIFLASLALSLIRLPTKMLQKTSGNKYLNWCKKIVFNILEGWNKIIKNRRLIRRLILLTVFNLAIALAIAKLEISALHLTISFNALILYGVLGSLSLFISITPANIGVKEAIYLFSSKIIGFSTAQILAVSLLDRGVLFLTMWILWVYFSKVKKHNAKEDFGKSIF
jgi:uncharacterized membrane protein YbhN (UPF0104 family)